MKKINKITTLIIAATIFSACKKDIDPMISIPSSGGSMLQLNGLAGTEPGSSAANTVFVDLSADKQTAVERRSWDLGFYCGSEYRIILNNTSSATAKALPKNDLTQVSDADTAGLNKLAIGFDAASNDLVDNVHGDLSRTVIAAVSSLDADNKVYIINRGTGGGIAARDWYKIRILLNTTGGYRLQFAKLSATTFTSVDINKDADYYFRHFSFDGGLLNAEPVKNQWDFKWSYTMYETTFGPDIIPFAFSDFISINFRSGVQAAEVLNSAIAYPDFAISQIGSVNFSSTQESIGAKWRSTQPATGVRTDRYYIIRDPAGNIYKLRFLAMGINDGGVRGRPQLEYKLVH